jgi:FkbM family methyltransferase
MFSKIVGKIYSSLIRIFLGTDIYRFSVIKSIHDYVITLLPNDNFEINNCKFVGESGNLYLTEIANASEILFCQRKIRKNMTVIDIGANVGYYTVNLANLVGQKGKVFAFEPDPINFSILEKNVHVNNFKNIILVNKSVSNKLSPTTLFKHPSNPGGHSIIKPENVGEKITVNTTTLDEYFKNFVGKIDLIKIDVEGSEFNVIDGGLNFFKKFKPKYLITEFTLNGPESLYPDILHNLGYVLTGKADNSRGNSKIIPITIDDLKKSYEHKVIVNLIWELSI